MSSMADFRLPPRNFLVNFVLELETSSIDIRESDGYRSNAREFICDRTSDRFPRKTPPVLLLPLTDLVDFPSPKFKFTANDFNRLLTSLFERFLLEGFSDCDRRLLARLLERPRLRSPVLSFAILQASQLSSSTLDNRES